MDIHSGAPVGQLSLSTAQNCHDSLRETAFQQQLRISDQSSHYLQQMKQKWRNGDKKQKKSKPEGAEVIEDMLCKA